MVSADVITTRFQPQIGNNEGGIALWVAIIGAIAVIAAAIIGIIPHLIKTRKAKKKKQEESKL